MKVMKLYLIILLFILAIPIVSADISLYRFSRSQYNSGDTILVDGKVNYTNNTRANLDLVLSCNGNSVQVAAILLDLRTNQENEFSRFVTLPPGLLGQCTIIFNLVSNNLTLESKEFQAFNLTNELKGTFDVTKRAFQLGDQLQIRGTITKQSNEPVDGYLILSFKQGDHALFFETVKFTNGIVNYNKTLNRIPTGDYTLDVSASDNFGNVKNFVNLFNLSVSGNLGIVSTLDKNLYSPGETLNLNGYVSNNLSKILSNINIEFDFGNEIKTRTLAASSDTFSINHIIPSKIKSGDHGINIVASDENGNYASSIVSYSIRAIPTVLNINLDSNNYDPEQQVSATITLLDQAGDIMQDNLNLYLLDVDDNVVDSKIVSSNASSSIMIPQQAKPGIWKLKVEGLGLQDESSFTVKEYQKLDASVDGTQLTLKNIGNIPFSGTLQIQGNDLNKTKDVKLDIGDSSKIKLDNLFPPGSYKIGLPSLGKFFDNVIIPEHGSFFNSFSQITGNVAKNVDSPARRTWLFVSLIVLLCGLIYIMFASRRSRGNKINFKSNKDYMLGQKKLDELKAKGIRKDKPVEYGKATQDDIDDWKRRVNETFKQQEQKKSEDEFLRYQQKSMDNNKPKGGMFNMFG